MWFIAKSRRKPSLMCGLWIINLNVSRSQKSILHDHVIHTHALLRLFSIIANVPTLYVFRRAREGTWRDSPRGMQTSSERITGTSWNRSRSCADEKRTLPECRILSSRPVIRSPFTCPENTRWANSLPPSHMCWLLLTSPSPVTHIRRPLSVKLSLFYCFRDQLNAVIGWHIYSSLSISPRFLLIAPHTPLTLRQIAFEGTESSREKNTSGWFDTNICLFSYGQTISLR